MEDGSTEIFNAEAAGFGATTSPFRTIKGYKPGPGTAPLAMLAVNCRLLVNVVARVCPLKVVVVGEFGEKYPPIKLRFALVPDGVTVLGRVASRIGWVGTIVKPCGPGRVLEVLPSWVCTTIATGVGPGPTNKFAGIVARSNSPLMNMVGTGVSGFPARTVLVVRKLVPDK